MATIDKSNVVSGNTINAQDLLNIIEALDGTSPTTDLILGPTTLVGLMSVNNVNIKFIGGASVHKIYTEDNSYFDVEASHAGGTIRLVAGGGAATKTQITIDTNGVLINGLAGSEGRTVKVHASGLLYAE